MSDSLKEQLLKAGFKSTEPAKKPKNAKRPGAAKKTGAANAQRTKQKNSSAKTQAATAQAQAEEAIEKRKALKAQIKALIDTHKVEKHQGDIAYGYTLGTRIKQIFVNEPVQTGLVAGDLYITRLNGSTYVVPADIGNQILSLNPEWVVVKPAEAQSDENDEYADFKVPDDIKW